MKKEIIRLGYIPAFDGLRGIAILLVLIYHLSPFFPTSSYYVKGGFLGVDVFFVLSGFLITSILLQEYEKYGQINLRNFYFRRSLRLVPAFWTFLIILYFGGNYILPPDQAKVIYGSNNFLFAFTYLMNWHSALVNTHLIGNLNHTWSLAIEEQFYLIWSLVLFIVFAKKKSRAEIFRWTLITIIFLNIWRCYRVLAGTDPKVLYYSTDTRIDELLIGCAAAMIYSWGLLSKEFFASRQFKIITFVALTIVLYILFDFSYLDLLLYFGTISFFAIGIAILILWIVNRKQTYLTRLFELKPLCWLGQISYGVYLWHFALIEYSKTLFESIPLQIILGLLLTILVPTISYFVIEKPLLKLKLKFEAI